MRRWVLLPLALFSALSVYLALERLTGQDAAFFRQSPKPFVSPPPIIRKQAEPPEPPEMAAPPAPAQQPALSEWTKLPSR